MMHPSESPGHRHPMTDRRSSHDSLRWVAALVLTTLGFSAAAADQRGAPPKDLVGNYTCAFTLIEGKDRYDYPAFPCVIRDQGGALTLEKTAGSQRIRGPITLNEDGFDFDGTFFCPDGDCTTRSSGHFTVKAPGTFLGILHQDDQPGSEIVVDLRKRK